MNNYQLIFDIKSDWHIGSGKEGGGYADALTLKDHNSLPYIPGKSCKGLLRDAFQLAANSGWFNDSVVDELFGNENRSGTEQQGMLQITSATLSEEEQNYLIEQQAARHLYRVIQSTAIDVTTGTAKPTSLRSLEVAVPMQLVASVNLNPAHPLYASAEEIQKNFGEWLTCVVALISEFGGKRHRGFGQVTISVQEA